MILERVVMQECTFCFCMVTYVWAEQDMKQIRHAAASGCVSSFDCFDAQLSRKGSAGFRFAASQVCLPVGSSRGSAEKSDTELPKRSILFSPPKRSGQGQEGPHMLQLSPQTLLRLWDCESGHRW